MMNAIILAGGQGTRLRPAWDGPKCLAPVGGRPFVLHLLDQLNDAGFLQVVICTGYKGADVKRTVGKSYRDMKIVYSHESEPLGTGGALLNAAKLVGKGPALVMNGDSYLRLSLSQAIRKYELLERPDVLLVAVYTPCRFGKHEVDWGKNSALLTRYVMAENRRSGWISTGVYVMNLAKIFKHRYNVPISLEDAILPYLIDSEKVAGFGVREPFIDIGTPECYEQAESFFNNISPIACKVAKEIW